MENGSNPNKAAIEEIGPNTPWQQTRNIQISCPKSTGFYKFHIQVSLYLLTIHLYANNMLKSRPKST